MSYQVFLLRRAQKSLAALPASVRRRIEGAVRDLGSVPRPRGSKKLTDRNGHRLRVGDHRIVYEVDDAAGEVTVLTIAHRRDSYR